MAAYITDEDFSDNFINSDEEFDGFTAEDIEIDICSESDGDSDEEFYDTTEDLIWKKDNFDPVVPYKFLGDSGPTNNLNVDADPLLFFRLTLELNFFNKIKDETNKYARLRQQTDPDLSWKPVEVEDIETFLGVSILMGINNLLEIVQNLSTDESPGNEFIKKKCPETDINPFSGIFMSMTVHPSRKEGMKIMTNCTRFAHYWTI
ncbi:hypothetical protein SNE40_015321 [Patella caerulea]|uniref:PiggyBac transposable element-derived protein domain-containing protein n=1 Tax=Patella caerulea TaxID=87958 RepID=A0AAN8PJ05_PATCE